MAATLARATAPEHRTRRTDRLIRTPPAVRAPRDTSVPRGARTDPPCRTSAGTVPIGAVPQFLADVEGDVAQAMPGARPVLFGHLGDGNIHANISQPVGMDKQAFLDRWDEVNTIVHGLVARCGGSISAEHGIGVMKRGLLPGVMTTGAVPPDHYGRAQTPIKDPASQNG